MASKTEAGSAQGFVGNIFKFSISTFANIGIFGVSLLLSSILRSMGFFTVGEYGQAELFVSWTNTLMTIVILGLDQALIRFYYKPPAGLTQTGLFRVCFYFSSLVLFVAGVFGSTLLQMPLYNLMSFNPEHVGPGIMPLLFLNAFFFMILRYFNVLYRMEMNIKVYTTESILMQFFYKLFYVFGAFLPFSSPVPAMILCSMVGLGGFALVFSFLRRDALIPQRGEISSKAYGTVLPYAVAIAPTAVMVTMNGTMARSFVGNVLGDDALGMYSYGMSLSNTVTLIQGGFATFWGAYMFENYETQKQRILRVHDYLNFVILSFFAVLVAFEDIMFWILRGFAEVQTIFPLMALSAVFTILCETTVYGNAIARKPIFDTVGIGLSFATNMLLCATLLGRFNIYGAAIALVAANLVMFLFRTFTAQRLYRSIESPARTAAAIAIAVALAVLGTVYTYNFLIKLLCSAAAIGLYCLLYRKQLKGLWRLGLSILQGLFKKKPA